MAEARPVETDHPQFQAQTGHRAGVDMAHLSAEATHQYQPRPATVVAYVRLLTTDFHRLPQRRQRFLDAARGGARGCKHSWRRSSYGSFPGTGWLDPQVVSSSIQRLTRYIVKLPMATMSKWRHDN